MDTGLFKLFQQSESEQGHAQTRSSSLILPTEPYFDPKSRGIGKKHDDFYGLRLINDYCLAQINDGYISHS